ncbi:YqcC family protein [Pseudomonas sp. NPDC087612]|uniref:YqcC family protein n=1 Tax=Pseudomonas TaxID=286 RepID=UPI0005EBAC04|nr:MULTISPECIES: YqcC family protein [unclassified Pseudomonas]KJK15903.1 pseudouridine synthase [Pseudomonas sp. 2(2015)]NLU58603.1 YqcC family protein [Pseudomonas sp. BIGb0427]QPG63738.1 YqcC family protein [Pseudomonas sp. BIGb0427]UVL55628.1 YqcC family protein [Pseudomonas sp. B21-035]UVL60916.1 YqcC family protein [Pseudomonas sp. B21-032]
MDQRILDIADHLLLIERELHVQGWWSEQPPSPEALASTVPFAVDSMNFDQWLQWIFLPRMKVILENGLALPNASGILVMAETVYVDRPEQSRELRRLLAEFDQLISPSA